MTPSAALRWRTSFTRAVLATGVLCLLVPVPTSVRGQSPRDELQQYIGELQVAPNNQAVREKIIRLANALNPPPAIPEEARRHFIKAVAIQKAATDVAGYELAINEYRQSLAIAPWWPEAYFNLSIALESSGKFDDAVAALNLYLVSPPSVDDARAARDRIYAIEGKKELAAKTVRDREQADREAARRAAEAAAQEAKRADEANRKKVMDPAGRWKGSGVQAYQDLIISRTGGGQWAVSEENIPIYKCGEVQFRGVSLEFRCTHQSRSFSDRSRMVNWLDLHQYTLSDDGQHLTGRFRRLNQRGEDVLNESMSYDRLLQ